MSAFTTCINISWDGCCCCCCLVAQLCLTLCYPIDCSPPGSSVHGWSQSRGQLQLIRQKESRVWVRNLWKVRADINTWENFTCVLSCFSHVQLFATQWTIARQALLSVGFSRHEYWSGLPCPSPGDLPNSGTEPMSLTSPSLAGMFFTIVPPGKPSWENFGWGSKERETGNLLLLIVKF